MSDQYSDYDAGLLSSFGGGDVEWWQDYLRAEIGRANDNGREQYDALLARVAELEKALEPFAQMGRVADFYIPDVCPEMMWPTGKISMDGPAYTSIDASDCLRALRAFKGAPQ